jgi:hypothetical protein
MAGDSGSVSPMWFERPRSGLLDAPGPNPFISA